MYIEKARVRAQERRSKKLKFCSNVNIKKAKHIISCAFAQPNNESASEKKVKKL
jgi:hypothetical protein